MNFPVTTSSSTTELNRISSHSVKWIPPDISFNSQLQKLTEIPIEIPTEFRHFRKKTGIDDFNDKYSYSLALFHTYPK